MTTKDEAHNAVRTLLSYIEGIDAVNREGLLDTPKRVIESWEEIFAGYAMDASELLQATFNAEGYEGIVLLRDIEFTSTCEHTCNRSVAERTLHTSRRTNRWHQQTRSYLGIARTTSAKPGAHHQRNSDDLVRSFSRLERLSSSRHPTDACSAEA